MIQYKKISFHFIAVLAIGFLQMALGCSKHSQFTPIPKSDSVIIPSQGIRSCYVGMPVSQLQDGWVPGDPENIFEMRFVINSKKGLSVTLDEEKSFVSGVGFQLNIEDHTIYEQPFIGTIDQGISIKSSIEEVIQTYGQPISITTPQSKQYGSDVTLYYYGRGIIFSFHDEVLVGISVSLPRYNLDPLESGDIGDTTKYRAIRSPLRLSSMSSVLFANPGFIL